jgi:hypoxanthine-DNA glycosylase
MAKKGRSLFTFTESEIAQLKQLFIQKDYADRNEQKRIRAKMRKIGFYITDFAPDMNSTGLNKLLSSIKDSNKGEKEYKSNEVSSYSKDKSEESSLEKKESHDSDLNENYKEGLEPWIDKNSEILILGSLPSDVSIKKQAYYQNKSHNSFWKLMHDIFGKGDDTKDFLLKNHIALWDCLAAANREGNLDANISGGEIPNKIPELLEEYSKINKIVINGKATKEDYFNPYFNELRKKVDVIDLPSSSNACSIKYEKKLSEWKNELKY